MGRQRYPDLPTSGKWLSVDGKHYFSVADGIRQTGMPKARTYYLMSRGHSFTAVHRAWKDGADLESWGNTAGEDSASFSDPHHGGSVIHFRGIRFNSIGDLARETGIEYNYLYNNLKHTPAEEVVAKVMADSELKRKYYSEIEPTGHEEGTSTDGVEYYRPIWRMGRITKRGPWRRTDGTPET